MKEMYGGFERVLNGKGKVTVFRDPVRKDDKFEHDGPNITKVYRKGSLLYRLGKKQPTMPKGSYAKIVHIEVDPNPGNMSDGDYEKEGFDHMHQFLEAFADEFGADALWRPAWRIECEVHIAQPIEPKEEKVKEEGEAEIASSASLPRNDKVSET